MKQLGSALLLLVLVIAAVPSRAGKPAQPAGQVVDAGSFGVFVNGKRVATESFQIQQKPEVSVATAELKVPDGGAVQKSELHILSNGNLRRYTWQETANRATTLVEPSEQFLIEKLTLPGSEKPIELAFILPASTVIVDDYFFSHRQVLLWRYLAASCNTASGEKQCKLEKAQFGIFVPRQQAPGMVTLEYKGREKVSIRGADVELDRFDLQNEDVKWSLWMDSAYKLQRIVIPSENTEVVRD